MTHLSNFMKTQCQFFTKASLTVPTSPLRAEYTIPSKPYGTPSTMIPALHFNSFTFFT